jgi:hypothetical protein
MTTISMYIPNFAEKWKSNLHAYQNLAQAFYILRFPLL